MNRASYAIWLLVWLLVLSLDGLTKGWAESALEMGHPVSLLGSWLRLTLTYNRGVAFGLLTTDGPWVSLATATLLVGLAGGMYWMRRRDQLSAPTAMAGAGVLGGGLANFLDRFPDGRVTDFLDLGLGVWRGPTFNLADVFITTSLVVWAAWNLRSDTARPPARGTETAANVEVNT